MGGLWIEVAGDETNCSISYLLANTKSRHVTLGSDILVGNLNLLLKLENRVPDLFPL